ncbi:unnamed protein product [Eruca vesicaria subsp. sativa]|uniref:Uncharacterized protein n=1 Tax=Eruca vesicaria subsp. sativa TaxID=29727 RepID=A0ABC8ISI7_ERUVS|nr:unnamed protein product [Eruca vesicaria subsp. sativa]
MSLAIAEVYTVREFHRESMKKHAKTAVTGQGDEKIVGGGLREVMNTPEKQNLATRFGRWFFGKPKKSSAKVSDPMTIE